MKETELQEARVIAANIVEGEPFNLIHTIQEHGHGAAWVWSEDLKLLARAVLALYNDGIEDDEDPEPMPDSVEHAEWLGRHPDVKARLDAWHNRAESAGAVSWETMVEEEVPLPGSYAEDGWPPWWQTSFDLRGARCRLQVGEMLAQNFHLNQRLLSHDQKPGFFRDLWRRITGTAWRVTNIRDGVVTVEQGR